MTALLKRLRSDQSGFTIVEGVVGALLLVIASLGLMQVLDTGTRNTYRAEQSQAINNRLQAELEEIRSLPYGEIALTSSPAGAGAQTDPRWRVSGTNYATARDGTGLRQMVVNGTAGPDGATVTGGVVNPGPEPFAIGDVTGQIYRFITWSSDPSCPACGGDALKRVIVAARLDDTPSASGRPFQEIQSDVVDPEATPDDNPAPPDDDPETATASFWLTDTPCNNSQRQPIAQSPAGSGGHPGHNTRGICSAGLQTGATRGAPDLMFTQAPALDPNFPPTGQPLYDYASDSEPATGGDDKGLLMPWASNDSCLLSSVLNTLDVRRLLDNVLSVLNLPALPGQLDGLLDITAGDANKHLRVHSWVTPPIQGSGGVLLGAGPNGEPGGTLELYTKTVNGAIHPGEICVWMSVRQSVTIPAQLCVLVCIPLGSTTIEVDLPMVNLGLLANGNCRSTAAGLNLTYFDFTNADIPMPNWPSEWTKISVPMCFAAVNAAGAVVPAILPPNSRIVLSLMVKRGGTQPGQGLEFMYDAVGYESRLELQANKIISF
jgi:Tfp pilus assembly protein PilV